MGIYIIKAATARAATTKEGVTTRSPEALLEAATVVELSDGADGFKAGGTGCDSGPAGVDG